jgi:hypothetical protein
VENNSTLFAVENNVCFIAHEYILQNIKQRDIIVMERRFSKIFIFETAIIYAGQASILIVLVKAPEAGETIGMLTIPKIDIRKALCDGPPLNSCYDSIIIQ